MMRLILLILTVTLLQTSVRASEDTIVAIVNKQPITLSELEQRKKIMRFFGNVPNLNAEQEKIFTLNILQSMVEDEVLSQYAKKNHINVVDAELKNFVKYIETNNKMPEGYFERTILNLHVSKEAFNDKIRAEVLRSKIIHEVLGQQVSVTRSDVDSLILDTNSRDAQLSLKVFTAKRNNEKTYKSMNKLSGRIKNCAQLKYLRYQSFATMNDLDTTLSALAPNVQGMIKDMSIGQATGVIKDDKMQIFVLCARQIEAFSDNDANQVSQMVAGKQLNVKARKFLQNLRKKAYVKVLI